MVFARGGFGVRPPAMSGLTDGRPRGSARCGLGALVSLTVFCFLRAIGQRSQDHLYTVAVRLTGLPAEVRELHREVLRGSLIAGQVPYRSDLAAPAGPIRIRRCGSCATWTWARMAGLW